MATWFNRDLSPLESAPANHRVWWPALSVRCLCCVLAALSVVIEDGNDDVGDSDQVGCGERGHGGRLRRLPEPEVVVVVRARVTTPAAASRT
jgi:hypothetical protein